jgi:hypothetical protein
VIKYIRPSKKKGERKMFQKKNAAQQDGNSSEFTIDPKPKKKKSKKWIAIVIGVVVVIGIIGSIGGGGETEDTSTAESEYSSVVESSEAESPEESASSNPLMNLEVHTADVKTGAGDVIGTRAWVSYTRSQFDALADDQIAEFALEVVDGADYNWFTIDFGDGTGVVFNSCSILLASLGEIDDTDALLKTEKYLSVSNDGSVKWELPSEEVSVEETSTEGTSASVDYDALESILKPVFDTNYPDCYTLEIADGIVTINVWQDGIAAAAVYAAAGEQTTLESWNTLVESMCSLSESVCSAAEAAGYENISCMLSVLNDQNMDNTLLTVVNGIVIYDAVNSSNAG